MSMRFLSKLDLQLNPSCNPRERILGEPVKQVVDNQDAELDNRGPQYQVNNVHYDIEYFDKYRYIELASRIIRNMIM